MENESVILFEEVQNKVSRDILVFVRVLSVLILVALIINFIREKGDTSYNYFLVTLLSILLILNFILPYNLTTQIRTDGIYVRFPPYLSSFSKFLWNDIADVYVREYNALSEYFGWGLRYSPKGTGYIVPGSRGIQIILKNGNRILITTQRPDEVNEMLRKFGYYNL